MGIKETIKKLKQHDESDGHIFTLSELIEELEKLPENKDSEILDWSIENYERFRTFCYNIRSPELVRKRITKAMEQQ
jgi:hypothetical protein